LISVFWLRAMVVSVRVSVPRAVAGTTPKPTPAVSPAVLKPDLPSLPGLEMTSPHGALLSVLSTSDPLEQVNNLNDEAQAFLQEHALESAIETLIKAEDIDPRNPDTLKKLAETYYLLNDPVRAKIYWQRLVDIGPAVGTIYAVAKDHVLLLGGHEADPLSATSTYPRQIYIDSVEKTPVETLNAQAQFHLRTTLMRKDPQMWLFDQKKLQPYVIFYQQMPDGSLTPDLGQHKGSFDDTFLFWSGKLSEAFGVDYLMPIPGEPGPNNLPTGKYYGFVIGIYYGKILQDARSEPSDLITRIPLPDEIE
jgi:tetratricopeptide (TPR) repeat protein